MAIVLVHGNLETTSVWDRLVDELSNQGVDERIIRLSPPGFGVPLPVGFTATMTGYLEWLIDALADIDEPIDLVGHDWGGVHVAGVAMVRPELLRTWASDALGLLDPHYVWHEFAQLWQDPDAGEATLTEFLASSPAERAEFMAVAGLPRDVGMKMFSEDSPGVERAVLSLYRSAVQPALSECGRGLSRAAVRPGLAIHATQDHYSGDLELCRRSAKRAGARLEEIFGGGHWWLSTHPGVAADLLLRFWSEHSSS